MTRSFSFLTLGSLLLLGARLAKAQEPFTAQVKVPFAFRAGSTILPAGQYEVRFDNAEMSGVLRVRSVDGHEAVFVLAQATDVPKGSHSKPRLVFNRDGDAYVLTEVVDPEAESALLVTGTRPAPEGQRTEAAAE
jgi:hypothetical protein